MHQPIGEVFKNLSKKLFKKKQKALFQHDVYHDWQTLVAWTLIGALIIVGIDGYIFYKVNSGELFAPEAATVAPSHPFDKKMLQDDNAFYDAREAKLLETQATAPEIIDPSL